MATTKISESSAEAACRVLRQQRVEIKRRYPHAVVLMRSGDWFEAFDDDARLLSAVLGRRLIIRKVGMAQRIPQLGFPYHEREAIMGQLIEAGYKLAVYEPKEITCSAQLATLLREIPRTRPAAPPSGAGTARSQEH